MSVNKYTTMKCTAVKIIKPCFSFIVVVLILISGLSLVHAQEKKVKLEDDKKKIEEEIEYNSQLLEQTKKTKLTTLNQLVILKNQIANREKLIKNINLEIITVNEQISLNNEILKDLNNDLKKLKAEYAEMIYYAYKNKSSYDKLIFIFASKDFNQAYKRLKYFQQYSVYRKTQTELIEQTQQEISGTLKDLENHKAEKVKLIATLEAERNQLTKERTQQYRAMRNLSKKEKELLATIDKKEKAAKKLQKEIEKIIAEEIRLAAKKAGTTATGSYALTPAEVQLSANFTSNKGGLPWPLERGMISNTFGEHPHPVLKNVKTKNNGIDIITEQNTKARAIFGGEVTRVMSIPNYNYVIMIRHGEYLSVYSNLDEIYVEKGDEVKTKQEIGRIHTDEKELKTELHFELWKGKSLLNPSKWLAMTR
ncbi:MAG: peptidoglycan DD-metalloendopeptidase family protein [Bacteroidales bacterium]|nr:peptidoglycan DD-metalloendopeptidase family protein [Bacteroidales bacterium]